MLQNYPNPFNPNTKIVFILGESLNAYSANVELKVFDVLGRNLKTLMNEAKTTGTYEINFDASELSSGVYFYQLRAGNFIDTKKLSLLK